MSNTAQTIEHESCSVVETGSLPVETKRTHGLAERKQEVGSVSGLIEMAINADLDIAKLERLMEMKEREETKTAKSLFNTAMARVQQNIQPIIADAENSQTGSRYSKLATIVRTLSPIYTAEGFSVSYGTEQCDSEKLTDAGWFRTTAELSHAGGFSKMFHVDLPVDTHGMAGKVNKTVIHGTKSAVSYARVILMGLMFNFTTSNDVDDDGNYAGGTVETITKEQAAAFKDDIEALGGDIEFFCNWMKVDELEDIPAKKFNIARNAIIEQKKAASK